MVKRGKKRGLEGHEFMEKGAAFADPKCMKGDCLVFYRERLSAPGTTEGEGHGACSCGARGPHGDTQRGRRQWFEEVHRPEMIAKQQAAVA